MSPGTDVMRTAYGVQCGAWREAYDPYGGDHEMGDERAAKD